MKIIILYGRRNVAVCALCFLVAKGYTVKVISDDKCVIDMAKMLKCEVLVGWENMGKYDLFLSVHGEKVIPMIYLLGRASVNVHPCLSKYKGSNPIKRYIENKDTNGSVEAHIMETKPDSGAVIAASFFETGVVNSYAEFYNIALQHYYITISQVLKYIFP